MKSYQYEAVSTELHDENEGKYKPLLRQLLVTSPVWLMYFATGISFGAPTVFIPQIRREANSTEAVSREMASWLSSIFAYIAMPFIIIICSLMPYVGRKPMFIALSLNTLLHNIVLYFSTNTTHILISEMLQGINHAGNFTLILIVLTEYTSPKYRGIFLSIKSATFYWGMWCANAIGTFFHWKYIPLTGFVLSLYYVISIFWPESPHWLASKGRFDECAKSYFWLMGKNETTKKELEHLINSQKEYSRSRRNFTKSPIVEIVTSTSFYKPTLISIVMMLNYNFSGKIVCAMYAIDVIKQITGSESAAYYGMLLLDGVTVAGMYFGCFLSKILKRRTLLLTTSAICVIFLGILALYLYLINLGLIIEHRYATACLLVGFSLSVSMGPILMLTSIHAELMPLKHKNYSMAIGATTYNLISGVLLKISPYIFTYFGMHGMFFFNAVGSGICLLVLYFYLPETKDKTLQEIADLFEDKNKKRLI